MIGAPFGERVVEHAVPGDAGLERQPVAENVRPGADDLQVDALLVEPGLAVGHRLDEPREERPHLEAVVELQRRRRRVGTHKLDADVPAARLDGGDQLRRHVVGVNVNRHAILFDIH